MSRGFTIIAYNTPKVDYVRCARMLARSLKNVMPSIPVCLITDSKTDYAEFDVEVIKPDLAPHNGWKLINDVHAVHSPWDYTIKIEADMYVPIDISWWFDILENREMNICTNIRNYRGEISDVDTYRQTFTRNSLLNTYNALTYYRRSELTTEFYSIVKDCFENWNNYQSIFETMDEIPTTDVVYAIAADTIGRNHFHLPTFNGFSFAHMKRAINNLRQEVWYHELIVEMIDSAFRINTHPQLYPVHYHIKDFCDRLEEQYDA